MADGTLRLKKIPQTVESVSQELKARNLTLYAGPRDLEQELRESTAELPPEKWLKGQLLNVRNRGEFYVITLLGEEDEPPLKPAPSGAMRFTNTARCQDFVSKWYSREHFDPRAW